MYSSGLIDNNFMNFLEIMEYIVDCLDNWEIYVDDIGKFDGLRDKTNRITRSLNTMNSTIEAMRDDKSGIGSWADDSSDEVLNIMPDINFLNLYQDFIQTLLLSIDEMAKFMKNKFNLSIPSTDLKEIALVEKKLRNGEIYIPKFYPDAYYMRLMYLHWKSLDSIRNYLNKMNEFFVEIDEPNEDFINLDDIKVVLMLDTCDSYRLSKTIFDPDQYLDILDQILTIKYIMIDNIFFDVYNEITTPLIHYHKGFSDKKTLKYSQLRDFTIIYTTINTFREKLTNILGEKLESAISHDAPTSYDMKNNMIIASKYIKYTQDKSIRLQYFINSYIIKIDRNAQYQTNLGFYLQDAFDDLDTDTELTGDKLLTILTDIITDYDIEGYLHEQKNAIGNIIENDLGKGKVLINDRDKYWTDITKNVLRGEIFIDPYISNDYKNDKYQLDEKKKEITKNLLKNNKYIKQKLFSDKDKSHTTYKKSKITTFY